MTEVTYAAINGQMSLDLIRSNSAEVEIIIYGKFQTGYDRLLMAATKVMTIRKLLSARVTLRVLGWCDIECYNYRTWCET